MAVNQNHSEGRRGAIIPQGESLLKQCSDVELSFPQAPQGSDLFRGTKRGTLFLTSYRVIFVTSRSVNDPMSSFMMPFNLMNNCAVEQPIFGANYIKGTIDAAPDGGWEGQAAFKLVFKKGGAIDFAQLMTKAAAAAAQGVPLGVANFWIGPPGIFIAGPQTMCTPQRPCQVIVYEVSPAGGYGAPPPVYGAPPPVYGAPPPTHGSPPPAYVAPPPTYGAPPPAYAAPPPAPGAPPPAYAAPPPSYGATPGGSVSPPPGYEGSPGGRGPRPSGSTSVPPGSRDPPAGSGAGPSGPEAAQTPGFEGPPPSTSSTQPHPPPS
uniref:postacrosomal sheath WW domain-binding protein n=1 Tax=Jaculus jaculus TaxID=51337 RepID=UPI001E1B5440|nr:postacrosomal sheath WW domain-binding protein [Jaculus jaculus]